MPHLRGANLLSRAHLRRGQKDHLERWGRGVVFSGQVRDFRVERLFITETPRHREERGNSTAFVVPIDIIDVSAYLLIRSSNPNDSFLTNPRKDEKARP